MGGTVSAEQQVHDLILKSKSSKECITHINRLLATTSKGAANVAPLLATSEKTCHKFVELLNDHQSFVEVELIAVLRVGQLLLKTIGMYLALGKANLGAIVEIFNKYKNQSAVLVAQLDVVRNIVECNTPPQAGGCCGGEPDPEVYKTKASAAARQAFFNAGGFNEVVSVMVQAAKSLDTAVNVEIVTKALEIISTCLTVSYNPLVSAANTRKLVELLKPHHEVILNFLTLSGEGNVALRAAAANVMQGLILHSNAVEAKAIQDLILTQGYLLFIFFGAISHKPHPKLQLTDEMEQILKEHAAANEHKSAGATIKAFRGLLSLTTDENANVETTLSRVIPRGLLAFAQTQRDAPLALALEKPLARGKVPEIQNLVWYQYHEKTRRLSNWEAVCAKFDETISEPTLLWTPTTRMELILAVGNEMNDLARQREAHAKSSWDYEGFEVEYPSLGVHLKVGDYYAHILLPLIEGANNYAIPQKDLAPLVSAAFQRAVIEDDNGWKLACIRIMSSLYKHYGSVLKDADAVPYLVWLLNAEGKTVNPLWRDHILTFLESLFQSQLNITKFVKAGGIKVLEYYLNLAHLPAPAVRIQTAQSVEITAKTAEPSKQAADVSKPVLPPKPQEAKSNITPVTKSAGDYALEDSEDEGEGTTDSTPSPRSQGVADSEDENPVASVTASSPAANTESDEKSPEDIQAMMDQAAASIVASGEVNEIAPSGGLVGAASFVPDKHRRSSRGGRRVQPCYINFLERDTLLEGIAPPMANGDVAARVLKLVEDIVNNATRLRRAVFKDTLQDTLTNLILCPIQQIADRALGLLNILLEANGHVLGRLHEKGTFLFVLYASREKFSSNATVFIDRYHKKPYIAREKKTTVLAPYLPPSLASYADRMGGAKLVELLEKDVESPSIIWNAALRVILNTAVETQVRPFLEELRRDPHLAQYEYTPPPQVRYPLLENELCVANVFVRVFNQHPDEPVDEPEFFLSELIRVFGEDIYKGDNITQLMRAQINMCAKLPDSPSIRPYSAMATLLRLLEACPRPYDFQNAHLRVGVRLLRLVLMAPNSGNAQKCIEHGGAILLARMLKEIGSVCIGHFESENLDSNSADNFDLLNQVLNALTEMLAFSDTDGNASVVPISTQATSASQVVLAESKSDEASSPKTADAAPDAIPDAADATAAVGTSSHTGKSTAALYTLFQDLTLTRSLMRLVSGLLKSNVAILRAQLVTSAVRFVSFLIQHSSHAVEHLLDAGIVLDAVYLALFHDVQAAQIHTDQNLRPTTPPENPVSASTMAAAAAAGSSAAFAADETKTPAHRGHGRKASHIPEKIKPPEHEVNVRHASAALLASLLKVPGAAEETQAQIRAVLLGLLSPGLVAELRVSPVKFISLVDKDVRTPTLIWNAEVRTEVRNYLDVVIEARNKSAGGTWIQARAPFTFRIKPVREEVMVLDIFLSVYNELTTPYALPAPITEATFLEAIISYAATMCVKAASSIKNILPLPDELKELAEHSESIRRTLGTAVDESHPRAIVCATSIRKLLNENPQLLAPSLEAKVDSITMEPSSGNAQPPSPSATDVVSTSSTTIVTTSPASPSRGRSGSVCLSPSSTLQNAQVVATEKIRSLAAFLAMITLQDSRLEHEVLCVVYTIASGGKEALKVLLHMANDIHSLLNRPRNYITDYPRLPLVLSLLQMVVQAETSEVTPKILTSLLENGLVASLMLIVAKGETINRASKTATLSYKRYADKNLNLTTIRANKPDEALVEAMRLGVGCVTYDLPYRQLVAKLLMQLVRHVHIGSQYKETLTSLLTVPFAAHLTDEVKFLTMYDGTNEAPDFLWNSACRNDLTNFLLSEVVEVVKHQRTVLSQGTIMSVANYPKYPGGFNYLERFDRPTLDAQIVIEAPYIYVYALNKMPYFKNLNEHDYYCGLLETLRDEYKALGDAVSLSQQAHQWQGPNGPTKQEIQDIDNLTADRRGRVAALLQSLRTKTKDVPQEQPNVVPYLGLLSTILAEETVHCPDTETTANVIIDHLIGLFATLATQEQIALEMARCRVASALVPHLYPVCVHRYGKKLLSSDENYTKRTLLVVDALQDLVRRSTPVVEQYIQLGIGAYIINMLLSPTVYNQALRQKATEVILLMGQDSKFGYEAIEHILAFLTLEFSDELCKTPELVLKMLDTPHESSLCKRSWNANVKEQLAARLREILPELTTKIQSGTADESKSIFQPEMISSVFVPYAAELDVAKIVANARQLAMGTLSSADVTVGNLAVSDQPDDATSAPASSASAPASPADAAAGSSSP